MTKISYIVCGKYKKLNNSKISQILEKILFFSIICSKCGSKDENISKDEESIKILKIISLINNLEKF